MVQHIYGLPIDNVLSANEDGGYIVTKYLIDCGHRRIGYIADVSVFETFSMRLTGYRKALLEAGIYTSEYEYVFCSTGEKPSKSIIGPHMDKITSYST